jgi:DNA polymerase-3 subunit gamma/tau
MPQASIVSHLATILEKEGISFDREAIALIGHAAAGSMRDALSLLDQAIAHGGGRVSGASVGEMLGTIDRRYLARLLEGVAGGDARAVLAIADEMQARSFSFDAALAELAGLLLRIAMAQSVPDALEADLPERENILSLAASLEPESVQLYYQIALQGRQDLAFSPDEHAGFVMTLLRMLAFRPDGAKLDLPRAEPVVQKKTPPAKSLSGVVPASDWPQLAQQLQVTGAARELARNAELRHRDNNAFDLVVPKAKAYLVERNYQEKLKAALEQHFGTAVSVKVSVGEVSGATAAAIEAGDRGARQAEATRAVHADGFVKDLVNLFDGKVVDSTIRENQK